MMHVRDAVEACVETQFLGELQVQRVAHPLPRGSSSARE